MKQAFIDWAAGFLGSPIVASAVAVKTQHDVMRLEGPQGSAFLKVGKELHGEKERLEWMQGRVSVPRVLGFTRLDEKDALLLSLVEGKNLVERAREWDPGVLVQRMADALRSLHSTDLTGFPFGMIDEAGGVLVHGDACLPNLIFRDDGAFAGFVDLTDAAIGRPEVDLSAAVWSIRYNLGRGYELPFLEAYGVKDASEEMVERLRVQYLESNASPRDESRLAIGENSA